jgi:hypothetical protein
MSAYRKNTPFNPYNWLPQIFLLSITFLPLLYSKNLDAAPSKNNDPPIIKFYTSLLHPFFGFDAFRFPNSNMQFHSSSRWDISRSTISLTGNYLLNPSYSLEVGLTLKNKDSRKTLNRSQFLKERYFTPIWDSLLEYKDLEITRTQRDKNGAMVALFRNLNPNTKIGMGFHITELSSSTQDLNESHNRIFFNLLFRY